MNRFILASLLCLPFFLPLTTAAANEARQECLGRLTFEAPEAMEWATYDADRTFKISTGGGHNFSPQVAAKSDYGWYGLHGVVIRVSDIVERSEFERAVNYMKGTGRLYQKALQEKLESNKRILAELPDMGYGPDALKKVELRIKDLETQISQAVPVEHDLGVADAYFIGGADYPSYGFLYRNSRVYYFAMSKAGVQSKAAFKDLISRFTARELYEVPNKPGVCLPYGFIADDGKTAYSIKNSLRFTDTPNVIFTLITASANDPRGTKPTMGTYDTDYRPGFDASKWQHSRVIEPSYIGEYLAGLDGWRLDPKPDSGEQERAWFALAHTGGVTRPLIAVQISTFKKGLDNLTEFTPPPEAVLPRWKALSKTIAVTLE